MGVGSGEMQLGWGEDGKGEQRVKKTRWIPSSKVECEWEERGFGLPESGKSNPRTLH